MEIVYSNDYLAHHGILGQKWGVRRYQNEDGSLTPAGRERYGAGYERASIRLAKAKIELKNAKEKDVKTAEAGFDYAWRQLQNEKIKNKLSKETKKSKHRQKLEAMYIKRGMSPEDAAVAAYKRARAEKIIGIAAGVALAAGTAYVGKKYVDNNMDLFLKQGLQLQHIAEKDMMKDPDDFAFYAAFKDKDMLKYRGLYGGEQLREKQKYYGGDGIYRNLFTVGKSGAKIANNKNARKTLEKMIKNDKNFASELDTAFAYAGRQGFNVFNARKVLKNINNAKPADIKEVYNRFNQMLVDHSPKVQSVIDKYYDKLKASGYAGIVDVNDKKYSGYNAKAPVIIFDRAKIAIDKVSKLTDSQLDSDRNAANKRLMGEAVAGEALSMAGKASIVGALALGYGAAVNRVDRKRNAANDKIVDQYIKEHPNTELTYTEIINMYKGHKDKR